MIQGDKPSGYGIFTNPDGKKREIETRMCVHCQMKWEYKPGSGIRRGYCRQCNGLLCGKMQCMKYCIPYIEKIEGIEKGLNFKELIKSVEKKRNIVGVTTIKKEGKKYL